MHMRLQSTFNTLIQAFNTLFGAEIKLYVGKGEKKNQLESDHASTFHLRNSGA